MNGDQRFFRYLRDRIGLDVASVGAPMIERAVSQRCVASGAADMDAYWYLLQGSGTEQQALIEAVIVPETWFMRYPDSFAALARLAAERLAAIASARPLRIVSLPCSTGEEPYSIAMALLDAGIAPELFTVRGIDISPLSIDKATRAVYGRNSFRGHPISFRDRHFTPQADGYALNPKVSAQVTLQVGNILDPSLLAGKQAYDFVFCRNLLIYFDVPTQQRVFEVLKKLTQHDGALFIGPAEGSLLARMGMRPIGIAQSFAFVRQTEPSPVLASPPPLPAARVQVAIAPTVPARPRVLPVRKPDPAVRGATAPAADAPDLLRAIAALANEGKSGEARASCEQYLREHGPQAQVFYWLGLLSDVAGQAPEAQSFYRKALYLDPQHPEALAQLAMILAAQGDDVGARRLQERAARCVRPADKDGRP